MGGLWVSSSPAPVMPSSPWGPNPSLAREADADRDWFVCPNYQVSRLPGLQDIVTFRAGTSPSFSS